MLTNKKSAEIKAVEMPPIKEYLKEIQRDGSELGAEEVLKETLEWLDSRGGKRRSICSAGRTVRFFCCTVDTP